MRGRSGTFDLLLSRPTLTEHRYAQTELPIVEWYGLSTTHEQRHHHQQRRRAPEVYLVVAVRIKDGEEPFRKDPVVATQRYVHVGREGEGECYTNTPGVGLATRTVADSTGLELVEFNRVVLLYGR